MKNINSKYILGALGATLGGVCWGLSGSMGQYLFTKEAMDSRWLVPIRLSFAGIALMLYCIIRYGKQTIEPWKSARDLKELLIYGITGVSLCQFLYFLTIQLSSAAVGTILQDVSPIIILAAVCITSHRKPSRGEAVSVFLAIIGVTLIVTHGRITELSVSVGAIVAGVASAFCVMIYNVVPKNLMNKYPTSILQAWAFLLGGTVAMVIFHPWTWGYQISAVGYAGIAFVVVVGNIVAFSLYMLGVKNIGPMSAILYGFSEPVTAAIVSNLLGTPFTLWDGVGFVLIFIMLYMISVEGKRNAAG